MDTQEIRKDLAKALENIDKHNYVLDSVIAHLEEQCTEGEVQLIEDLIFKLDIKEYNSREEFYKDYQPIFDTVDFPFKDCFITLDKRKLNWDKL